MEVRLLPHQPERVESGPVQFGDDWPGVFIRGDNAGYFALTLSQLLNSEVVSPLQQIQVKGLIELLTSCNVRPPKLPPRDVESSEVN